MDSSFGLLFTLYACVLACFSKSLAKNKIVKIANIAVFAFAVPLVLGTIFNGSNKEHYTTILTPVLFACTFINIYVASYLSGDLVKDFSNYYLTKRKKI